MMNDRAGAAERELATIADRFATAAASCIRESLARSVERLVADHADHLERLDDATVAAFRSTVNAAIETAAEQVASELRRPDLWTSPRVRVREDADLEEISVLGWLLGEIGLRSRRPVDEPEDQLDDPNNRAWIALLNAADPLDPVLVEFGFAPSRLPNPGGGHFGLQPRTLVELDPHGRLAPIWREYVRAFNDHRRTTWRSKDDVATAGRARALDRWRRKS